MSGLDPDITQYSESKVPYRCGTCFFFVKEGRPCQVVNYPVKEDGCCNFWTREKQFYTGPIITPEAAAYVEGGVDNHNCESCRYLDKNKFCPVNDRFVSPDFGSCNAWSSKEEKLHKSVINKRTGKYIVNNLEIANTLEKQVKGLLGRSFFKKGQGLLIPFSNQIHTNNMQFAIDVLFLDDSNKVVHIIKSMPEGYVTPKIFLASKVLELPSGIIKNGNVLKGDILEIK